MCQWSLDLTFKAKLKLGSWNWKIQYGWQPAILEVTSLKINRLLPIATNNMHMKFEIKIPMQTLCSRNHVIYRWTDKRTSWTKYTPPPSTNFVERGHKDHVYLHRWWKTSQHIYHHIYSHSHSASTEFYYNSDFNKTYGTSTACCSIKIAWPMNILTKRLG